MWTIGLPKSAFVMSETLQG